MNAGAELEVEHLAWQGWFEILDDTEQRAAS